VQQTLAKLIALQELDRDLARMEAEASRKPGWLEVREREWKEHQARADEVAARVKEAELEFKRKELDIGAREEQAAKLEVQLNAVKTNRDFSTIKAQIEGVKADCSRVEEEAIILMTRIDELRSEQRGLRAKAEEARKEVDDGLKMAAEDQRAAQAKLDELKRLRDERVDGIPGVALDTYGKILKRRDGMAMAAVVDQACQGCNMTITTHELTLVTTGTLLVQCGYCNRILYLPKLAEPQS